MNPATNPYNYLQELDRLRNQMLQSIANPTPQPSTTQFSNPAAGILPNDNQSQITDLIVKTLQNEIPKQLAALGITPPSIETEPAPINSMEQLQTTIETKINQFASQVLNKEQFEWLTDPQIFASIPLFLKTQKGKDAIGLLVDDYKSYIEGK
jgi:hypothetical protein